MIEVIIILILLALIAYVIFFMPGSEGFSTSGLAISDRYCQKLADVYYKPQITSPKCRDDYRKRICGYQRRNTIDTRTGNYFTDYGVLI